MNIFNQEVRRLISSTNDPTLSYINNKYKEVNNSSYFKFFEDYLYQFGIITIGYSPTEKSSKFLSYINCREKNIFNAPEKCSNISDEIHTVRKCQIINANYIISNLKRLSVFDLENWRN